MPSWLNACTSEEVLPSGLHRVTISLKPRAWDKPQAGGGTKLTEIPPGFGNTGDAQLPHGRQGLLDTRFADRLAGQSPQVHVGRGNSHLRMSALGTANVPGIPVLDGVGRVIGRRYNDAWNNADLVWLDIGHRVEKHIPLRTGHPSVIEIRVDSHSGNIVASPRGWDLQDDGGNPVLWAGAGYLYDHSKPLAATVPVPTSVRVQGGKQIYRYELPAPPDGQADWAGWTLEPTWTSQPGAEGNDCDILSTGIGDNDAYLRHGEDQANTNVYRSLIKFDLSSLSASAQLTSVVYSEWLAFIGTDFASNNRTHRVYRQQRAWVETQATWNIYSTGNNWGAAGGFDATDCEQTSIGSSAFATTDAVGARKDYTLTPTTKAALDLGNGWMVKADTEANDLYIPASGDHATAAYRPTLEVVWAAQASGGIGRGRGAVQLGRTGGVRRWH